VEWIVEINSREQQDADYQFLVGEMDQLLNQFVGMKKLDERQDARVRLKQLEYNLGNYDEGVPEESVNRLYSIYDDVEREERRAHALRLTTVGCAVLVTGGLLAAGFYYRSEQNALNAHVDNLTLLVEQEDFAATDRYIATLEKQSPEVLEHPSIVIPLEQHRNAVEQEQARVSRLTSDLASLEESQANATTIAALTGLSTRLDEVESLCRYENELNDVDALRVRITSRQGEIQTQIDEKFTADLNRLNDEVAQIDSKDVDGLNQSVEKYIDLEGRPEVPPSLRTLVLGPKQRVLAIIGRMREGRAQSLKLDGITGTVGSWPNYQAAIEQFAKEFPQSTHGLQMQRVLSEEASLWGMIEQRNDFVTNWSRLDFSKASPQKAQELVKDGREFRIAVPGFEAGRALDSLLTYLESVGNREDSSGESIVDPLVDVLRDSNEVSGLYMVMTKVGDRFYSDEEPRRLGEGAIQIKQFTDAAQSTKVTKVYYMKDLAPPPREGVREIWMAPQSIFALDASTTLTRLDASAWEDKTLQLLDKLTKDTRMEPIIKFQLLAKILPVVLEGSSVLKESLQGFADEVDELRLGSNLNWYDPMDVTTQKARKVAERFFKVVPDIGGKILQDVAAKKASLLKTEFGSTWQWCAWLYKDSETQLWTVATPKSLGEKDAGELFVATTVSGELRLTRIGEVQKGAVQLFALDFGSSDAV